MGNILECETIEQGIRPWFPTFFESFPLWRFRHQPIPPRGLCYNVTVKFFGMQVGNA